MNKYVRFTEPEFANIVWIGIPAAGLIGYSILHDKPTAIWGLFLTACLGFISIPVIYRGLSHLIKMLTNNENTFWMSTLIYLSFYLLVFIVNMAKV